MDIIIPDASLEFPSTDLRYDVPYIEDALFWHFTAKDADYAAFNHVDGRKGSVIGAPVFSAYEGAFQSDAYIQARAVDPLAGTFLAIARSDDTQADPTRVPELMGNYTQGQGATLYVSSETRVSGVSGLGGGAGNSASHIFTNPGVNNNFAAAFTFGPTQQTVFNLTADTSLPEVNSGREDSNTAIKIGSAGGYFGTGKCTVLAAAAWKRELSSAELQSVYQRMKVFYADRGIAI